MQIHYHSVLCTGSCTALLCNAQDTDFGSVPEGCFESAEKCLAALQKLTPSPNHMVWFEYNFLFILAARLPPALHCMLRTLCI